MSTDWRRIAADFDARARNYAGNDWHRRCADRLVELCHLEAGERILDAGTGTGLAALAAARVVGSAGRVLAVDVSPGMLREARSALEESGLTNVEFLQGDATSLPHVESGTFDVVTCAAALLYMPVSRALAEWCRVSRPGGRVGFSTMRAGAPAGGRIFRECAAALGVTLRDPSEALGSEAACRSALIDAGCAAASITCETVEFSAQDHALAWESNFKSSTYAAVRSLSAADQQTLRLNYLAAMARAGETSPSELDRAEIIYAVGLRIPVSGA